MTQAAESWTVGRLLEWTKDYLQQQGSDSARLDAELLLAHARGCDRIQLYTCYEEVVDDQARGMFRGLVKRRANGEPVAYLVEQREFYSLPFRVTSDVLIPRPETEFVVMAALDLVKAAGDSALEVLDVGTGSGAIAASIARFAPQCRVTAVDISASALEIARGNIEAIGVADRVTLLESDLFSALEPAGQFDVIVSNPPYVSQAEYETLPVTVRDYEPRVALVGGVTGAEPFARLVDQAAPFLRDRGWLIVETSPMLADAAWARLERSEDFVNAEIIKDLAQLPRVVKAQVKAQVKARVK